MKKIIDTVFVVCFVIIISVPMALFDGREGVVSDIDNRELVEKPSISEDNYTELMEQYVQDRIGLREEIVNGYSVLNDFSFNELTHPLYTYGKNGYVFFNMHTNIQYGDYHKQFVKMVSQIQSYCEARGTKFYFVFEPEKISVYRDLLPAGVNYDDSWVNDMCGYMDELGINYVNYTELLVEKSKNEQVFNKVYDAGHWNDLGAFYATNYLWERVGLDFPSVTPMREKEFNIYETEVNYLPVSTIHISEMVPVYEYNQEVLDLTADWKEEINLDQTYSTFFYMKNMSHLASNYPRMLVFQGSYYNRNPQFLESRANTYIGVHNYQNILNFPYYYNIFKPDVVVLDAAEYVLSDVYFDYQKMCELDMNPYIFDNGDSINEQMNRIVCNMEKLDEPYTLKVDSGKKVDDCTLNKSLDNVKYAYLIVDKDVYDFVRDEDGRFSLSLEHGNVNEESEVYLIVEDENGEKKWTNISVELR